MRICSDRLVAVADLVARAATIGVSKSYLSLSLSLSLPILSLSPTRGALSPQRKGRGQCLVEAPVAQTGGLPSFYNECLGNWNIHCVGGQPQPPRDPSVPQHWYGQALEGICSWATPLLWLSVAQCGTGLVRRQYPQDRVSSCVALTAVCDHVLNPEP